VTDYSKWQTVPIPVVSEADLRVPVGLPAESPVATGPVATRRHSPRWVIGAVSLAIAVATVILHIVAVSIASGGDWAAGTVVGYVAIGTSILGIAVGALAILLSRGRGLGIVAVVVSILANPYLLLQLLNFFSGR
jgi:hypothetical protein